MSDAVLTAPERRRPSPGNRAEPPLASEARVQATIPFPVLAAPTVVHVSKLSSEAIARCDLREAECVVIEPERGGVRLRVAGIEVQLKHEQEAGLGRVTYSLGEFLDEFTNAPSNPAPTFDRLAQFKRDYVELNLRQRELFRSATRSRSSWRHSARTHQATSASHSCESSTTIRLPRAAVRHGHARDLHLRKSGPTNPATRHLVPHRKR